MKIRRDLAVLPHDLRRRFIHRRQSADGANFCNCVKKAVAKNKVGNPFSRSDKLRGDFESPVAYKSCEARNPSSTLN